jgi:hypothetical protein
MMGLGEPPQPAGIFHREKLSHKHRVSTCVLVHCSCPKWNDGIHMKKYFSFLHVLRRTTLKE